eukprot:4578404-Prymnesium_polylepis.1
MGIGGGALATTERFTRRGKMYTKPREDARGRYPRSPRPNARRCSFWASLPAAYWLFWRARTENVVQRRPRPAPRSQNAIRAVLGELAASAESAMCGEHARARTAVP